MIDTQKIKDKLSSKERLEKERSKIKEKVLEEELDLSKKQIKEILDNEMTLGNPDVIPIIERTYDLTKAETEKAKDEEFKNHIIYQTVFKADLEIQIKAFIKKWGLIGREEEIMEDFKQFMIGQNPIRIQTKKEVMKSIQIEIRQATIKEIFERINEEFLAGLGYDGSFQIRQKDWQQLKKEFGVE